MGSGLKLNCIFWRQIDSFIFLSFRQNPVQIPSGDSPVLKYYVTLVVCLFVLIKLSGCPILTWHRR